MLQIKNIHKQYKTGDLIQKALDGVSLNLRDNEFVAILGPSGSGKTTLLNIIGGLDRYDQGDLIINGVSTKKYKDRDWDSYRNHTIGFVFQSYNLIPHQTVFSNVELALTISGVSKSERKGKVMKALEQVGLDKQAHKRPNQMSGGQMQRVAIARALVNDPDILLADEPTGALDSETSVQVMELLKEVAKDRLVVMVTHNPELAEEYATRIVKLKDGTIRSDSDKYEVDEKILEKPKHMNLGKASMSFTTALQLSFNNLRTKKARTILTSFAGSIGIIGIALILALSTGVSDYIQSIEENTLSEYPLQIQSSGMDITAMISDIDKTLLETDKKDSKIHVSQMITNLFSRVGSNDLVSLKKYIEDGKGDIKKNTKAIEYKYNVVPQIYSSDSDKPRQIHPDNTFQAFGIGNSMNSMMNEMANTDSFYQLPTDSRLYEHQYDIKAGRWPKDQSECVLVLTKNGNINDLMLYTLGLRDYKELDQMVKAFLNEENVTAPKADETYDYDELIGKNFKVVSAADYYEYDKEFDIYKDKTNDKAYMKNLVKNGQDLNIVGIVKPVEDTEISMLKPGIGYPSSLTDSIIKQAANTDIVKKQLADPKKNVFTGKSFNDKESKDIEMDSLFTVDENQLKQAFHFDESKLQMGGMDLSGMEIDPSSLPALDTEQLFADMRMDLTEKQITDLKQRIEAMEPKIMQQFQTFLAQNQLQDPTKMDEYFQMYLQSEEANLLFKTEVSAILSETGLVDQFQKQLETSMTKAMNQYMEELMKSFENQLASQMNQQMSGLEERFQDAFSVDTEMFEKAIKMKMNKEELQELMMSLMTNKTVSLEANLKDLGYADTNKPSTISIYPKDFASKQNVIKSLDQYNADMKKIDEDKAISYTDYVGALMSSVTDIINVISYVLIAFVAISLIVSSIMIGVITYISVLERKKEIGILRAVGASKRNISQVFNAETFIVGLLAGLIGIGVSLLFLIPANMIIHSIAGNDMVNAVLPASGAIILIALSVILTLLGGLIPSKKAAKADPVTALRSE